MRFSRGQILGAVLLLVLLWLVVILRITYSRH